MLRRIVQRLVRLSPRAASYGYSFVPEAIRRVAAPWIHPIAAGNRSSGFALHVPSAEPEVSLVVLLPAGAGAEFEVRARELAAGHRVVELAESTDPTVVLRAGKVVDAVVLCSDDHPRAGRLRRFGHRVLGAPSKPLEEAFPRVSIVIVTCGNPELCRSCVRAVFRNTPWLRLEVIVVDNGAFASPEDFVASTGVRQRGERSLRVVANGENLGFARASNQGIRMASGEFVVLLNDDTVVGPGWLSRLVAALEQRRDLGLVCAVTNQIGNDAKIDVSYGTLEEMEAFAVARANDWAGEVRPTRTVALFCAAARRADLQAVDLLDERFEVGMFEDDDLSRKLRLEGLELGIAPGSFVHHVGQASFAKLTDDEYLAVWEANKERFEEKWGKAWKPPT